jgi:hypothetical protein
MRSRRIITPTIAWLVALAAAMPAAAAAGSLLSGYGGPGQGNQAILGSALLNGGGGPQNGGGSNGGAGLQGGGVSTTTVGSSTSGAHNGGAHTGRGSAAGSGSRPSTAGRGVAGLAGAASGDGSRLRTASSRDAASRERDGSETLGLTGADISYVLLALLALIATGILTRRIARTAGRAGTGS